MARNLARAGVIAILLAIIVGPFFSHPDYSSLANTTSELGGQGMANAWIMNAGFLLFGSGCALAALLQARADPLRNLFVLLFGLGLIGAALCSTGTAGFGNQVAAKEDWWHSFFATSLGFAFALACTAAIFGPRGHWHDVLSWAGLIASVALPLAMVQFPQFDGALQRLMFFISFLWVWHAFSRPRSGQPAS